MEAQIDEKYICLLEQSYKDIEKCKRCFFLNKLNNKCLYDPCEYCNLFGCGSCVHLKSEIEAIIFENLYY